MKVVPLQDTTGSLYRRYGESSVAGGGVEYPNCLHFHYEQPKILRAGGNCTSVANVK